MQKTYDLYRRSIAYWYLLLIPLIAWGFYQTYFSVLLAPRPSIIHVHFALMTIWAAILVAQPMLIRYKKNSIHRTIGKISYVVMPLLLVTGFLLIRFVYYRSLDDTGVPQGTQYPDPTNLQLQNAADSIRIIFLYLFWLGFFLLSCGGKQEGNGNSRKIYGRRFINDDRTNTGADPVLFFWYRIFFWRYSPGNYFFFNSGHHSCRAVNL